MIRSRIVGTGRGLPQKVLSNADLEKMVDNNAQWIIKRTGISQLRIVKNERGPLASPEEAAAFPYTDSDRARIRDHRSKIFVGTPDKVRDGLAALIEETGADELMAVTSLYDHEARKRSYTLLAEAFGLRAPA